MEKKRSLGVTILAVLFIISGAFKLISFAYYICYALGKPITPSFPAEMPKEAQEMFLIQREVLSISIARLSIVFYGLGSLVGLILGIGLFKLNEYIRRATVIFTALYIPANVIVIYFAMQNMREIYAKHTSVLTKGLSSMLPVTFIISVLFTCSIGLCVIFYLTRPKVKEQFK